MFLILNIFPDYLRRYFVSYTPHEVAVLPYHPRPHRFAYIRKLLEYLSRRYTLHYLYHSCRSIRWRGFEEHMHVVFHYFHRVYIEVIFLRNLPKNLFNILTNFITQNMHPILRHPHQVIFQVVDGVFCPAYSHTAFIPPTRLAGQTSLLRLTANRFPPPSKLGGIQRSFL